MKTPEEGWALVSHHLGNLLLVTMMYGDQTEEGRAMIESKGAEACERAVFDGHTKLIGTLYTIALNLNKHGHAEEAAKVQKLLDMVIEQDVTNPEVARAIRAKHEELDPSRIAFRGELEKLRAANSTQS